MDNTLASLVDWLPRQRWFAGHGIAPRLRLLADLELPSTEREVRVHVLIVADESEGTEGAAGPFAVYQIPLVERSETTEVDPRALIGSIGGVSLIDGPRDAAFTGALLALVAHDRPLAPAEVLSGEQSNTSIIFQPVDGHPIICKLFRRLNEGQNPDIELQSALSGAGSAHVPAVIGVTDGAWTDPADAERTLTGSLAFAQEFFPGVEDAWRVALRFAETGEDFTAEAFDLGRATAEVHLDLARLFSAPVAGAAQRAELAASWARRLEVALTEVPALRTHDRVIRAAYARAASSAWPALQRIHGDFHLGQVLRVPGRGWVLLDFEGEPMRPMNERREPDLALRDIAGMLRSFDYVAGSLARSGRRTADAEAWAVTVRRAFLDGYRSAAPDTGDIVTGGALLDALELDKAVYEASYESRYRPDWLPIPLAAIDRLTGVLATGESSPT